MILQTPILALLLASALASAVALWAAWFGIRLLRHWDLASGSQTQLDLERRTELVSTLFGFVMLVEITALFLLVFNADRMAALFVGAMCAVGTFNVNGWGFPALYLKITLFFAAALWLILDRVDRLGRDFPLTRLKFAAILGIAPLVLAGFATELAYFLNMKTDVITSCCSKLFTPSNEGLAAEMTGLPPARALWLLAAAGGAVLVSGAAILLRKRGETLFAIAGAVFFFAALTAIVSVISLYVYDHPNHHCPFCLLKREYGYFGYALYVPLFAGTALALATGLLKTVANSDSLAGVQPKAIRHLTRLSLAGFALFGIAVLRSITTSQLILFG
ncbi:hypothetical protein [Aliiruegeria sabulilitoris]|uniref:hypothetical protein n=1 Tax=Aliiruegeria sabulilitoris TaxID=1510458 RepID=UPI00083311E8|nr:hypothetical protein [Aliiruegeria sabulilitoris]NDR55217.1 hypothetical protein [Pseudoruegeria sp. M32A2M]